MTIGLTEEQVALAAAIAQWADGRAFPEAVRSAEGAGHGPLLAAWGELAELGILGIAVPEASGGAGGTLADLACALEAAAEGLVPGPLLSTATGAALLAGSPDTPVAKRLLPGICDGSVRLGLAAACAPLSFAPDDGSVSGDVAVVADAVGATHLLLGVTSGDAETWLVVPADGAGVRVDQASGAPDLSRTMGSVHLEAVIVESDERLEVPAGRVRDLLTTLAAAEAAGAARWALRTAVDYAGVREQFGRKIGSFQAIKHLCAEMLERAESATAVAWGAAAAQDEDPAQQRFAAAVAGAVALDAAVRNVKDCIQVLGGIGFTWEHDAHLYLRRALQTRQLLGGPEPLRESVADQALEGVRRTLRIVLDDDTDGLRESIRADVDRVRAASGSDRRAALAETGLLMPHWPSPYGRGADARTQLVIDQELTASGIARPDLGIGAWAAPTIMGHGTQTQKERFLPGTLRGDIVWCQLFSEPEAGSDLASLRTKAERVEGGWRLSGQKVWTSLAQRADWAICLARTNPDAPQHKGITYFLLDMRSEGIEIRPLREMTGEVMFNEVFLDGVVVPDDCVVGEVDSGWNLARTTLANERVAMSGSSLGMSVEQALRVVQARGGITTVEKQRLGAVAADAVTVTMLGSRSTLRSLAGQGPGAESSVQKLVGVRHRQESAELAYELLGPEALLGGEEAREALHQLLLTRCLSIAGGTTQVLRNVAAERILGLPRA